MSYRELTDGRKIQPWISELEGKSGVYLIREKGLLGSVLYVGESHTGRLKKTMLRHFQQWTGKTKGPTFPRTKVEVAVVTTRADRAIGLQNSLIEKHRPKHNIEAKPGFFDPVIDDDPF